MKVISFNANGIRAAARKGFFEWLNQQQADVLCVQETKAQHHQLSEEICYPGGVWHSYYSDAEKKGYSGVAIYCRKPPQEIRRGLGIDWVDREGRYIEAEFGNIIIASLYLPSGSSGDARQNVKMDFLEAYTDILRRQAALAKPMIICGDFNIVHKQIDIANWKSNQKTSGCLPEERAWLDIVFGELGWIDAFREVNREAGQYTWWSNRGRAREKNVGWRIDYHIASFHLKGNITGAYVYKGAWFSDHAPLSIEYDWQLR